MIGEVDEVAAKNNAIDGRILNEMGQKASYSAMCTGRLLRKIRCFKMAMTNVEPEDSLRTYILLTVVVQIYFTLSSF